MSGSLPPVLISADCHVTEPLDLWSRNLPPGMRDRGPRLERREGRACLMAEGRIVRKLPPLEGAGDAVPFFAADTGPESRLRALDRDGLWAEVMYPNLAFFCTFAIGDPQLQAATCRVYNEWVADRFGASERLVPVGLVPVGDVRGALSELERLEELGLRAALLPTHADHRPYNDPAWTPLWEAAEGLGIPLGFHAGTGRSQTPARGPGAAVVNYVVTLSGAIETVSYLCGAGVLERHPGLRVGMVECGAGWLAWTLDAMDDAYREHHAWVRPKLAALPGDYFRRQGFVTFQRDPVGLANAAHTGSRCLLWGSDYPHPEGTFPDSRAVLEEQLRGIDAAVAERVVCGNAAELYRIPLPAPAR